MTPAITYSGPLTDDQIAQYHRDGYIAINGLFTPTEVAELGDVTNAFIEASRQIDRSDDVFDLEPGHSAAVPRLRRLKSPHHQHEAYARALRACR